MSEDADMLRALGEALRRTRRKTGLSQECAADLAGLQHGTVVRIERGENCTLKTLLKLSQAYECHLQITIQRVP
jgi:DNA-binding XRE family transcriptional regulator